MHDGSPPTACSANCLLAAGNQCDNRFCHTHLTCSIRFNPAHTHARAHARNVMAILLRTRHLLASSGSWSLHRCLQGRSKCPGVSCGLRHVESGVILAIRSLTFANINLPSHKPTPLPGETAAGGGTATSSGGECVIWEGHQLQ